MLHIDFWFEDLNGQLVVIGWSDTPTAEPHLVGPSRHDAAPLRVDRHVRADLGTTAPLAFVALFAPKGGAAPDATQTPPDIGVRGHDQTSVLPPQGMGFLALAETAVNEAFDRVLLLLASGRIALATDPACNAVVRRRMAGYQVAHVETADFGVAVDHGVVSRGGAGLLEGWFLADRRSVPCSLHGFSLSNSALSMIQVFAGQIDRPDLEGFKARYDYTGRDGFAAATIGTAGLEGATPSTFAAGEADETQFFLVVDAGASTTILLAPTRLSSSEAVGQAFVAAHRVLKRADHRRALMQGLLGQATGSDPDEDGAGFAAFGPGATAVLVDVDVHGDFAGDLCLALSRMDLGWQTAGDGRPGGDRIVLLVDRNDSAAFAAVDRTLAELDEGPRKVAIMLADRGGLEACLGDLAAAGVARLVFGRASILFHLADRAPGLLAATAVAQVLVFSTQAERQGLVVAEALAGYQPIVLTAPVAALHAAVQRSPKVFITEEAIFKHLTTRVPDRFPRILAPSEGILLGQDGKHNAVLVWGQNAYTVDSLILSMLSPEAKP